MWFIVCADLGYFYSPSGIILSALELLASKAAPAISACEMHGVVCGFCITQPFGYAMEELIELFGNEEVVDQEMLESFVQAINEELLDESLIFSPLVLEESDIAARSSTRPLGFLSRVSWRVWGRYRLKP